MPKNKIEQLFINADKYDSAWIEVSEDGKTIELDGQFKVDKLLPIKALQGLEKEGNGLFFDAEEVADDFEGKVIHSADYKKGYNKAINDLSAIIKAKKEGLK